MKFLRTVWYLVNLWPYVMAPKLFALLLTVFGGQYFPDIKAGIAGVGATASVLVGYALLLLLSGLRIWAWIKNRSVYIPPTFTGARLWLSIVLAGLFVIGNVMTAILLVFPLLVIYVTSVFVLMCTVEWPDLYRTLRPRPMRTM